MLSFLKRENSISSIDIEIISYMQKRTLLKDKSFFKIQESFVLGMSQFQAIWRRTNHLHGEIQLQNLNYNPPPQLERCIFLIKNNCQQFSFISFSVESTCFNISILKHINNKIQKHTHVCYVSWLNIDIYCIINVFTKYCIQSFIDSIQ